MKKSDCVEREQWHVRFSFAVILSHCFHSLFCDCDSIWWSLAAVWRTFRRGRYVVHDLRPCGGWAVLLNRYRMTELLVTPFRPPPFSPTWWSIVMAPVDLHLSKQKLWPKTCRFVEGNQNKKKRKKEGKKNKVHTQASQWHADASLNYSPWLLNTDTKQLPKTFTEFWMFS